MSSSSSRCETYLSALRQEFPKLRIVSKRGDRLSTLIDGLLRVVTLGGQGSYLTGYVTTLGQRIYVPLDWEARSDEERYIVLRHEAVHLRQFQRYTWAGMVLIYGVPLLPLGLALGRARLEWEAYAETLRATAELRGLAAAEDSALHDRIVAQFTGPAYGWMWPFPGQVRRWIHSALDELRDEAAVRAID